MSALATRRRKTAPRIAPSPSKRAATKMPSTRRRADKAAKADAALSPQTMRSWLDKLAQQPPRSPVVLEARTALAAGEYEKTEMFEFAADQLLDDLEFELIVQQHAGQRQRAK